MDLRKCKYCESIFDNLNGRQFSNHVRWCTSNNTNGDKGRGNIKKAVDSLNNAKLGELLKTNKECLTCGQPFVLESRYKDINSKNYCSIKCRNTVGANSIRVWSDNMRIQASIKTKELWKHEDYVKNALSNRKNIYTSKCETEIREHFISSFPKDSWTFGGVIRYSGEGLVRDLYSNVLKICIEYDGIWHFKDIHGQLSRKKHKDILLEDWCIKNGWRLIRIDEDVYLANKKEILDRLINLVYVNTSSQIVKLGDRYGKAV